MAMQSPDFTNPVSWAWNATVDRELPWAMRGSVSYVGRSASHLERARNINQLQPGTIQANPGVNANALRPYLGFSTITLYETTGRSRYNSLQTQVERRSTRGVGFGVAYTLSRTKDNGSGRNDMLPNAFDDSGYYGISDLDRPQCSWHRLRYRFPTLESSAAPLRWVLGDWDVSGMFQATVGCAVRRAHAGRHRGRRPGQRPAVLQRGRRSEGTAHRLRSGAAATRRGSTATAFQAPAAGTFGTQAQNTLRYPGLLGCPHVVAEERRACSAATASSFAGTRSTS